MNPEQTMIFNLMKEQHYYVIDKLPARQDNLFRTYLWLASLSVTLNILLAKEKLPAILTPSIILCVLSIVAAILSLNLCLYAMRGKQPQSSLDLYEYYDRCEQCDENTVMLQLVKQYWDIINLEIKTKSLRGRLLRAISWGIVISFVLLGIAAMLSFIH